MLSVESNQPSPGGTQEAGPFVVPRPDIVARSVRGRYRRIRNVASSVLQILLFAGPWLRWDGHPAILLDLPGRKLYLFGLTFWPQETYFLWLLLVSGALTLFCSTALAGRMWCGYACPQTLFTQSFMLVERLLQGDRARRLYQRKHPTAAFRIRRAVKVAVWAGMAAWLGITMTGYLVPIDQILSQGTGWPLALFVGTLAFLDFGFFREQVCYYICPYAKFQASMFDRDSLIVGYDARRGEPRGSAKSGTSGSCVDCSLCVQVCPMGIDIRNGLQLECIACAACVDACDSVMDKLGRPRGLIRYCSQNSLEGQATHIVRARVIVYAILLASLGSALGLLLWQRTPWEMTAVRQAVVSKTPEGGLSNLYQLRLINRDSRPHTFQVSLEGISAQLVMPSNPVVLAAGSMQTQNTFVVRDGLGVVPFRFKMQVDGRDSLSRAASWVGVVTP